MVELVSEQKPIEDMPGKKPDQMTEEELKIAVQRKFERERELDPVERERSDEMKAELR